MTIDSSGTDQHRPTHAYELADRFRLEDGRVFLSGVQALARLPVDQLRLDRRLGLTTAAFASGYQGSPVGTFTEELRRAAATVDDLPIVVQPAVNEELAATAVMGSQLAMTLADARYDGVVGIWYGKGPGFDRSSDAIRHAVFAGTSMHGGVVAVVGDDPGGEVVDTAVVQRRHDGRPPHADPVPRRRPRGPRSRTACRGPVTLVRTLGRTQARHGGRRRNGDRRRPS